MRYLLLLAVPFALTAQAADTDSRVTQALISEIQQLRLAIERSTLLGARTQLAISQLQMHEATTARLSGQLDVLRMQGSFRQSGRIAEEIKSLEEKRQTGDPAWRSQAELQLKQMKFELEQQQAMEQQRAAREGELGAQLQAAQNQAADARARIAEMERALDAAIQQLLKK